MGTLFAGPLAGFERSLVRGDAPGSIPCTALAEPAVLASLAARFGACHRASDRRAAVSLWSQAYFNALVIPAVVTMLEEDGGPALGLSELQVSLSPETGLPRTFHLHGGRVHASGPASLVALLDDHVAPLVASLREASGLSAGLLWENAGWPLVWSAGQVASANPACSGAAHRLLEAARPSRGGDRLAALRMAALAGTPVRRRLCCLRYRLPGFERCAGLCPRRDEGGPLSRC